MSPETVVARRGTALKRWLDEIERLVTDIEKWAKERDWQVARLEPRTIAEEGLGTYTVSDLRLRTHSGILNVEVVARNIIGAAGRVDLVAFPTLDRFMLVRRGRRWVAKTDSGEAWPQKWGKATFVELARKLTQGP